MYLSVSTKSISFGRWHDVWDYAPSLAQYPLIEWLTIWMPTRVQTGALFPSMIWVPFRFCNFPPNSTASDANPFLYKPLSWLHNIHTHGLYGNGMWIAWPGWVMGRVSWKSLASKCREGMIELRPENDLLAVFSSRQLNHPSGFEIVTGLCDIKVTLGPICPLIGLGIINFDWTQNFRPIKAADDVNQSSMIHNAGIWSDLVHRRQHRPFVADRIIDLRCCQSLYLIVSVWKLHTSCTPECIYLSSACCGRHIASATVHLWVVIRPLPCEWWGHRKPYSSYDDVHYSLQTCILSSQWPSFHDMPISPSLSGWWGSK